jgi:hypothetical protein
LVDGEKEATHFCRARTYCSLYPYSLFSGNYMPHFKINSTFSGLSKTFLKLLVQKIIIFLVYIFVMPVNVASYRALHERALNFHRAFVGEHIDGALNLQS